MVYVCTYALRVCTYEVLLLLLEVNLIQRQYFKPHATASVFVAATCCRYAWLLVLLLLLLATRLVVITRCLCCTACCYCMVLAALHAASEHPLLSVHKHGLLPLTVRTQGGLAAACFFLWYSRSFLIKKSSYKMWQEHVICSRIIILAIYRENHKFWKTQEKTTSRFMTTKPAFFNAVPRCNANSQTYVAYVRYTLILPLDVDW